VALVAFALGEGGDINNTSSKFNPLNTGLNAPELLAGGNAVDGTQAFKSFDAGVEGTARTMLGSYQNRLAKTLSDENTTAKDFMKALTYYGRYKGNKFWAAASLPPNQDSYYHERLSLVNTVKKDYANIASLVIGTDALEQQQGTKDKSKLTFADGGGDLATTEAEGKASDCTCGGEEGSSETEASSDVNGKLAKLAEENGGKTTISVESIDGKIKGNSDGNSQMPTRSSYKIYTAYATLRAIEDGKISWSTKIWNGNSVEKTMEEMIVKSNNDAAEALRTNSKIGDHSDVTKMLQDDVGLSSKTVMGGGSASSPAGTNSKSSANDFVKFLVKLEKKELIGVKSPGSYDKLISFMKRATTDGGAARAGIVAGVDGAAVADKPGWASGSTDPASNDVGIVYLDGKPYAVAVLTDKPNQWDGVAKIAKGVHGIMGGTVASEGCPSASGGGDISSIVKEYAWPSYSNPNHEPKPEYKKAHDKAASEGLYVGGGYTDCGAFVSRVMLNSGYEPKYNSSGKGGNTLSQQPWLEANWQKISVSSTKDLQPGDVAINSSHTFMFVGDIEGFNGKFASASLGSRVPMAGQDNPTSGAFSWYRKK
ncbi:serine hydrolase, partial [Candidatus Saccharibacteria bacterium]|nr:serine hydrolase [Candidatus Saccharibacteria bacterium]